MISPVAPTSTSPFEHFTATKYFANLDGLRAVSIILVMLLHSGDQIGEVLHGTVGVTIFFVISGFIITTLLLRDEDTRGRASLSGFYVRRIFRILPLYYVVLAFYCVALLGFHLTTGADAFRHQLPYYLAYNNEFGNSSSPFGHTWSLAVEEKFYLVWPLLAVAIPAMRRWRLLAITILIALSALSAATSLSYFAVYYPIALGCLVALLLHRRLHFTVLHRALANTPVIIALAVVALAFTVVFEQDHSHVHIIFSTLAVLMIPAVVAGPAWLGRVLACRPMLHIGTRSYALYLVHFICFEAVNRVLAPNQGVALQIAHITAGFLLSLAAAEILHRTVERPMIRLGRHLTHSQRAERSLPEQPQTS